jgi:16S rRNA (guanine966-N2)-methyltransferase
MRITGGTCRGTPLAVPPGLLVRPTRDAVRQALFNIIGDWIVGKRILDLYSGSGSLGMEALSRGAASAVFVENHPDSAECIKKNLKTSRLEAVARIQFGDVLDFLSGTCAAPIQDGFHCMLADPPFAFSNSADLGKLVDRINESHMWAIGETVCMIEVEAETAKIQFLEKLAGSVEFRRYGRNLLAIARANRLPTFARQVR